VQTTTKAIKSFKGKLMTKELLQNISHGDELARSIGNKLEVSVADLCMLLPSLV
jgi:hypothetical protein